MAVGSVIFAFAAGLLSSLSPCVQPILPIVFGTALAQHRAGPAALAAGVALSFTAVGLFVAALGFSLGFDGGLLRNIAAVLMIGFAMVMLVPSLQNRFAAGASRLSSGLTSATQRLPVAGLRGQFLLGLTLGVWSGVRVPGQRSAQPPFLLHRDASCRGLGSPCWYSGSAPPCR